ncbi:MAG: putative rane protein [Herbinix sp.]|jgi:chromate transporter|nr:putative rane protein [Herbinix sp.]
MIYLKLFLSFVQIGLFSIGGGYAALPLIQEQVVDINHWLTMAEFTDLITISGVTPGPIAINAASFVGNQLGGVAGALVATFGCVLPSFIIVIILAFFYFKYKNISIVKGILSGIRPAVVALIASAGVSILIIALWGEGGITAKLTDVNYYAAGIFFASLFVLKKWKPDPLLVMAGSGIIGVILYFCIGVS